MRVIVVGAGIAGLSAALAMRRAGQDVVLVDRAAPGHEGTAMGVQGEALRILAEFGLEDAATYRSTQLRGRFHQDVPMRGFYRPALVALLLDACIAVGVDTRFGASIDRVGQDEGIAWAEVADGTRIEGDLVVAADGIRSAIRGQVFGPDIAPAYAGQHHLRWMMHGPHIPDPPGMLVQDWGKYLGYPLPGDITYSIIVFNRAETDRIDDAQANAMFGEMIRRFRHPYTDALAERFSAAEAVRCRPFEWLLAPPPWHRGRIVLIGDAAHATTAHMSYGGGLALEDGAVLAHCLAERNSMPEALDDFTRRRFDRVQAFVRASLALSEIEQGVDVPPAERALIPHAFGLIGVPYAEPAPLPV